jgi:hypothetical protein
LVAITIDVGVSDESNVGEIAFVSCCVLVTTLDGIGVSVGSGVTVGASLLSATICEVAEDGIT